MAIIYKGIKDLARDWKDSVWVATAAALPAYARVGNTITANAVGAVGLINGQVVDTTDHARFLLKDGASHVDDGIYRWTSTGAPAVKWSAVRDDDANTSQLVTSGMLVPVEGGTIGGHVFELRTPPVIDLNTTALTFADLGASMALVTQTTSGSVNATGAVAGAVFCSGAPTVGGAFMADLLVVAGLVTTPGDMAIGAAAMSGTERLRVTGDAVLFDGAVGVVPVAGAGTRFMWCPAKYALRAGQVAGTTWDDASVGTGSVAFGLSTTASGTASFAHGNSTTASGTYSTAFGQYAAATGPYSFAQGYACTAALQGQSAASAGIIAAQADAQRSSVNVLRTATDAGAVELTLTGGAPAAGTRVLIPSGKTWRCTIEAVARCTVGTDIGLSAGWSQKVTIGNIGGTTTIVGAHGAINLDATLAWEHAAWTPTSASADDAGLLAMTLIPTADDANDCLVLTFTGHIGAAANTWHVNARIDVAEVA